MHLHVCGLMKLLIVSTVMTCQANSNVVCETEMKLRTFMEKVAAEPILNRIDSKRKSAAERIFEYSRTNNLPMETVTQIACSVAQKSYIQIESGNSNVNQVLETMKCKRMLAVLGRSEDLTVLPFLDKMSDTTNRWIRETASMEYIRLAGVNAISFLKKVLEDNRYSSMDYWQMYEEFGNQIVLKKQKKIPTSEIEKAIIFLLSRTKAEHTGDGGKQLDIVLCNLLPEYVNSIQRIEAAQWFIDNGSNFHKRYFDKIKTEIEKVPKEKRKDFKAKGELLDPERLK